MSLRNREHLLILLSKCWWVAQTWFSFSKKVSSVTAPGRRHSSSSMARMPFVFWGKGNKKVSFLPHCTVGTIIPNSTIKHNQLGLQKQRNKTNNTLSQKSALFQCPRCVCRGAGVTLYQSLPPQGCSLRITGLRSHLSHRRWPMTKIPIVRTRNVRIQRFKKKYKSQK